MGHRIIRTEQGLQVDYSDTPESWLALKKQEQELEASIIELRRQRDQYQLLLDNNAVAQLNLQIAALEVELAALRAQLNGGG